jgi:hypothetical protein
MYGIRCATELLKLYLIFVDVVGFVVVALNMLQLKRRAKEVARLPYLRWIPISICKVWGIPFGADFFKISDAMVNRYAAGRESDAVAYVDRVIDRQINKARGILPFNSILIAALSLENRSGVDPATSMLLEYLSYPIIAGLFISSILLLELFWVHWGKEGEYKNFEEEAVTALVMARDRSLILDMSIILSIACIFGLLLGVVGLPVARWIYGLVGIRSLGLGVCGS